MFVYLSSVICSTRTLRMDVKLEGGILMGEAAVCSWLHCRVGAETLQSRPTAGIMQPLLSNNPEVMLLIFK